MLQESDIKVGTKVKFAPSYTSDSYSGKIVGVDTSFVKISWVNDRTGVSHEAVAYNKADLLSQHARIFSSLFNKQLKDFL